MKASTLGFEEIGPEHVILVSWDGEVLEGELRRHAEYPIHTELMRARPDVASVVHTHAPWAVAFASTGQPLRPVSHEATLFVPPEVARFTKTGDLILTPELGSATSPRAVADRNAAFMLHHGIVTCGLDVVTAVMAAVLLERACRTNIRAIAGGGPKTWSADEEALSKREHCYPPAAAAAGVGLPRAAPRPRLSGWVASQASSDSARSVQVRPAQEVLRHLVPRGPAVAGASSASRIRCVLLDGHTCAFAPSRARIGCIDSVLRNDCVMPSIGAVVRGRREERVELPRELARVRPAASAFAAALVELAQQLEVLLGRAGAGERYRPELDDQPRLHDVLGADRRPSCIMSDIACATMAPVGAVTNAPPRAPTRTSIRPIASSDRSASRPSRG